MTIRFAILLIAIPVLARADDGIISTSGDPDKTGKLYDVIADFIANSEKVESMRFAFVAKGMIVIPRRDRIQESPVRYLTVRESKSKRLDASAMAVPSSLGTLSETWIMELQDDGKFYRRDSPLGPPSTRVFVSSDERDKDDEKSRLKKLRPCDQTITTPNTLMLTDKHYEITYRWLFDGDVPKIDKDAPDWREPLRVIFDLDWQRRGVRPPLLVDFENRDKN